MSTLRSVQVKVQNLRPGDRIIYGYEKWTVGAVTPDAEYTGLTFRGKAYEIVLIQPENPERPGKMRIVQLENYPISRITPALFVEIGDRCD